MPQVTQIQQPQAAIIANPPSTQNFTNWSTLPPRSPGAPNQALRMTDNLEPIARQDSALKRAIKIFPYWIFPLLSGFFWFGMHAHTHMHPLAADLPVR